MSTYSGPRTTQTRYTALYSAKPVIDSPVIDTPAQRAAELIKARLLLIRLYGNGDLQRRKQPIEKEWQRRACAAHEFRRTDGIGLRLGEQRDGTHLHVADLDTHKDKPWQNAQAVLEHVKLTIPAALYVKLVLALSTGLKGRYILFRTPGPMQNGKVYDTEGRDAGELLSSGKYIVCPAPERMTQGTLGLDTIPLLTDSEAQLLLAALHYRPGMGKAQRCEPATPPEYDDRAVQFWLNHQQRGGRMVNADAIPHKIKRGTWTYKLLADEIPSEDRSRVRFRAIEGMVKFGYRDARIIAYGLTYLNDGKTAQTPGAILKDILRCIAIHRAAHPDVQLEDEWYDHPYEGTDPITVTWRAEHTPQPKQRGRPRAATADEVYRRLLPLVDGGNLVMLTRRELQAELGIPRGTLDRRISELVKAGRLIRHTSADRQRSWLELLGVLKNTQSGAENIQNEVFSTPAEKAPEIGEKAASGLEILQKPDAAIEETRWVEGPPASPLPSAPVTVLDAVSAACDVKGEDSAAAWRYFRRTFPHLVSKISPHFAIAKNKFMAELYESELAFRECASDHAGALDIVHLGQVRASRRLQQPPLLDVTGVSDLDSDTEHGGIPTAPRVSSKDPVALHQRVETESRIVPLPTAERGGGERSVSGVAAASAAGKATGSQANPLSVVPTHYVLIRDPRVQRERAQLLAEIRRLEPMAAVDYARCSNFDLQRRIGVLKGQGVTP